MLQRDARPAHHSADKPHRHHVPRVRPQDRSKNSSSTCDMCILPARRLPRPWLPARMPPSLDVSAKLSRPDREARSGRRLSVLRAWSQGRTCEGEVKARSRRGGDAARSTRHQPPLLLLFPLDWVFLAPSRRSLGRKRQDVGTAGPPPAYVIQRSHTGAALRPSGRARAGQSPALDALRWGRPQAQLRLGLLIPARCRCACPPPTCGPRDTRLHASPCACRRATANEPRCSEWREWRAIADLRTHGVHGTM